MYFTSLGNFQSSSQGLVYVGLKLPISREFSKDDVTGFYRALTNIELIHQNNPEISHQLPLFYGLLIDPHNKPQAIITEDFSHGAKHKVMEYRNARCANIPDGLVDLFDSSEGNLSQLEKSLFYIKGKRKIGDLDHLFPKEKYEQDWEKIKKQVKSSNPLINFTKPSLEELIPDENERRYANFVLEACQQKPQDHTEVIHVDPEYRINTSSTINHVLDLLVDNGYLKMWRDEDHPMKQKMFALQ